MKKILFLTFIIALLVLSACSSQTTIQESLEDELEETSSSESSSSQTIPSQTSQTPSTTVPDEIPGNTAKCTSLISYELQDKCRAIENRDIQACAEQPKKDHLNECVIEVAKFSYDTSKASECSVISDNQLEITCEALLKQDVNICLTIPKAFGASEQMRECVYLVSTKMQNKKLCETFVKQSDAFVNACMQNCYTRWTGINAQNYQESCEERVDKGFEALY